MDFWVKHSKLLIEEPFKQESFWQEFDKYSPAYQRFIIWSGTETNYQFIPCKAEFNLWINEMRWMKMLVVMLVAPPQVDVRFLKIVQRLPIEVKFIILEARFKVKMTIINPEMWASAVYWFNAKN